MLTQPRHTGEDVHVAVDDGDRHPQLLAGEEELLRERPARVGRQLDHAQAGAQGGRVLVPVEVGLVGVRLGELLHERVRFGVENEGEIEGLGDGCVGDVVVARVGLRELGDVRWEGQRRLRWADAAAGGVSVSLLEARG